jgi:hypothetical protein
LNTRKIGFPRHYNDDAVIKGIRDALGIND